MSAEQRYEGDVTSDTTEIATKDVAAHNNSYYKEDAGSVHIGEERDNTNTSHVDIRNGDVRNSDARKSREGGGKTLRTHQETMKPRTRQFVRFWKENH
jgi:hypothetical protein